MMLYRRALSYFRSDRLLIGFLLVLIAVSVGLGLLQAWPTAVLVDAVLTPNPHRGFVHRLFLGVLPNNMLAQVIGVTLIGMVLKVSQDTIGLVRNIINARLRCNGTARVRQELFDKLVDLDTTYHRTHAQGDALFRISNDIHGMYGILDLFIASSSSAVMLVVMIVTMLSRNASLTLLALSITPLMMLANIHFGRTIKRAMHSSRAIDTDFTTLLQRSLSSMSLIQLFGRQMRARRDFASSTDSAMNGWMKLTWQEQLYPLCVNVIYALGGAVIFGYGGYLVWRDQFHHPVANGLTIGDLMVFMAYLGGLWDPLRCLTGFTASVKSHSAAVERVFAVLDHPSHVCDRPGAVELPLAARTLELRHVAFSYRPDAPVLIDANATIRPGEFVAFVGPSGAGKSTLLHLLPRFYDPTGGAVLLDGVDVRDVRLADVRKHVALVPQESPMLVASIAENIAFGRPDATPTQIQHAAVLAGADSFIDALPDGYATVVAEGATNLSGGQRQRLSIARALLTEAPILVLDEPTSALDAVHENLILQTLRSLRGQRTVILVTHRMNTVRDCDRVFVLKQGAIKTQRATNASMGLEAA